MNREQANALVEKTFQAEFDKDQFARFAGELLNGYDDTKAQNMSTLDAFAKHVKSCQRLGTYTAESGEKVDILVVNTVDESKLDRTRTGLRNFVAHKLKRDESYKEAGLVAFVAPDRKSWRFSYVRMEYQSKRDPVTGKIAVEDVLTPARRFSYLVGKDENCHTAKTRFLSLLQDTDNKPSLIDLEKAFSVEAVTDEFFDAYKKLYDDVLKALEELIRSNKRLAAEFDGKGINRGEFVKKLLGQIVFLYFIQKKGWLGVADGQPWGSGPKDFLRQMVAGKLGNGKPKNFFNDALEPLFYKTLADDRGHRAWSELFQCRIPFLNGGLFEPLANYDWKNTEILLPNDLFTNRNKDKQGSEGTGILDVFDRYNFTVNEAEPLEKEVAIDPEMLGKVFENLIEENLRKGQGAYYTPREIVHYMCQECLINYLDTTVNSDKQNVPRKDLEDFIRLGEQYSFYESAKETGTIGKGYPVPPKSIKEHARAIDAKLESVTVCDPAIGSGAFPVGMMQEIVRARMALTPYFNDHRERTPYYFKRHAIQHSLYGVDMDAGAVEIAKLRLWLSLVVDEEDVENIKPLPNLDYKIVTGNSLSSVERTLFNEEHYRHLENLKPLYFDASDKGQKETYKHEIDKVLNHLTSGKTKFDFTVYFSEIFHEQEGFDVTIMNPPYGAEFSDLEKLYLKERFDHISERIRNSFMYFMGLGYELGKDRSIVCLIIPNEYLFQIYMTKARRYFLNKTQILFAVNTGEGVFKAIVPTCITAFKKIVPFASYPIPISDLRHCTLANLEQNLLTSKFDKTTSDTVLNTPNSMFSFDLKRANLVTRLSKSFPKFDDYCVDIANGISTSCDDVYIVNEKTVKERRFEDQVLKPCIRGGQFNRFNCPTNTGDYVLYITDDLDPKTVKNTYSYLAEHRTRLIEKCVEKKNGSRKWSILFRARNPELFGKPKILIRQTADRIIAAADTDIGYYCIDSVNVAILKSGQVKKLPILLALLNSAVANFFYREISQEAGRVLAQVKPQRIKAIPIPEIAKEEEAELKALALKIQASKKTDPEANISPLMNTIDSLLYKLYGLTPDEIKLVEASTAK